MCKSRLMSPSLLLVALALTLSAPVLAGPSKAQLDQVAKQLRSIPTERQKLLSSGLLRVLQFDTTLNADHTKMGDGGDTFTIPKASAVARSFALSTATPILTAGLGGTIAVSDPRLDFVGVVTAGFTQSETASARCGNNVVAGYNDSGAFARTAGVSFADAWSFSSASFSHDGGQTFAAIPFMNPGTEPANFIAGDPVLACTSPTRFYYASIFASGKDAAGNFYNGVALNVSNDGGETWGPPIAALQRDFYHSIDKPWLAADPSDPRRLYVTYTDFDFSGFSGDPNAGCPNDFRIAIELVASRDGGATWSAPTVIHQECESAGGNGVQGSNVAVGSNGRVYIAYEFYPATTPNNEIRLVRSLESVNGAMRFSASVKVGDAWPNGSSGRLQGGFRTNEFPQLAIDRSGEDRDIIYLAWTDGVANIVPNLDGFFSAYAYSDVLVARSNDGGRTFTLPQAVSPTPSGFAGKGRDQFFPGIAVDRRGVVGLCYYDRRQNPSNDLIDRYCATSRNRGASWTEQRVSNANWLPLHFADSLINSSYIGDYDAVSSDFLLQNSGFFSSFEVQNNGNPDVVGARFR